MASSAHRPAHAWAGGIARVCKCEVFVQLSQLIGCCGTKTIVPVGSVNQVDGATHDGINERYLIGDI
jgi:hypothetical protein